MESEFDRIMDVVTRQLPADGIPCLMIGGHAVNHYGVMRATQDIDFMIAASDADAVRHIMRNAGFTNLAVHETVMFFNRPGSPLRVDFLKVEQGTLRKLLEHAVTTTYAGSGYVRVPQLKDLMAMKLFALTTGGPKRMDKDFSDIVHLAIENQVDVETDLKPLCHAFGTEAIYAALRVRIEELRHA